jgi:hypothetical protein
MTKFDDLFRARFFQVFTVLKNTSTLVLDFECIGIAVAVVVVV